MMPLMYVFFCFTVPSAFSLYYVVSNILMTVQSLFGSSASRNPGNPMVNMLMSDICEGSSGYVIANIAENMACLSLIHISFQGPY